MQLLSNVLFSILLALVSFPCFVLSKDDGGDWVHMKSIRPKGYICLFSSAPIKLDGKIDDAVWKSAAWTEEFVDIEGYAKPKPRQSTRAKMLWDSQYLYIAAELKETDLQGTLTEHDSVIFQDNDFEVFIDPDGDNHNYVEFELNALNTTWDLLLDRPYKDGGKADNGWEFEGIKSAVYLDGTMNNPSDRDNGWTVEIAIPWSAFRKSPVNAYPPQQGDRWRVDFSRVEWQFDVIDGKYVKKPNTKEDNWVWSPQGIIDMHRPERWGFVQFEKAETAPANDVDDVSMVARDTLMEVYHRQRGFHSKNNRWAATTEELGISVATLPAIEHVRIDINETGYHASYSVESTNKINAPVWNVRQDSRLWATFRKLVNLKDLDPKVSFALSKSGANRHQLEMALEQCTDEQFEAMQFLVANMPDRDLTSLNANYLLENTRLAFDAWNASPWKSQVPKEIFFNEILPYANINESRDDWRREFRERFMPLIADAKTISQAAARINQKLFPLVNVRYSTKRARADQSPLESMRSGLASCTGLSILMIDACRACGIPARFVGIPLWPDKSGNHSWVEVWDNGWHFTGAAEASGDNLDVAWFADRASTAIRDNPLHSIYAVSFQRTPLAFPLVWNRSIDYIRAVNVTDRYTQLKIVRPAGTLKAMFRVLDSQSKQRVTAKLKIADSTGKVLFEGDSNDERFDSNDHISFYLPAGGSFTVTATLGDRTSTKEFKSESRDNPIDIVL
jgi:Carbohydrate family 9 binding domain-like/Transglutaminase-like superfamily